MNCPQILDAIEAKSRGATRPRMTLGMLKELAVPLPQIADQVRLVVEVGKRLAAVDAADASIRTGQDAVAALPAAMLRRAFLGGVP
jgi:type I restriction enzyme S subunit